MSAAFALFWCFLMDISSAYYYARLTDEHYSVHFPQDSDITIPGTDGRFSPLTFSTDYAMMSWVQIQEIPSITWNHFWQVEKPGHDRVPGMFYFRGAPADHFMMEVGTTLHAAGNRVDITIALSVPLWVHVSIRACQSGGYSRGCVRFWGNTLSWSQTINNGDVVPFGTDATVRIGKNNNVKMQIFDLRYYSGTCLLDSEIDSIIDGTNWFSGCNTGWWGPGNYSCNAFLTLVDTLDATVLDNLQNEGDSYVKWENSDSFLMGKTFDSLDTAFSGWTKVHTADSSWHPLWRAGNSDWDELLPGWRVPSMSYQQSTGIYRHCHADSEGGNNQKCIDSNGGITINNWNFVVGSSCQNTPELHSCVGNLTGGMNCQKTAGSSSSPSIFNQGIDTSYAHLWIGGKWSAGPDASFKDVRYYHQSCLLQSELAAIKNSFTCTSLCVIWSDPETCTEWIDGFTVQLGVCVYTGCSNSYMSSNNTCESCDASCEDCDGPANTECSVCNSGWYILGNTCLPCDASCLDCNGPANDQCTICYSSSYMSYDNTCQPCAACCQDCYGPADSQWTVCNAGCYLQPAPSADTCLTSCPTGYYIDTGCQACDSKCATCSSNGIEDCITCNAGDYLVPTGSCESVWPLYTGADSQNVCQACHDEACALCSVASQQDCVTCIEGWRTKTDQTKTSECLCDMNILDNSTPRLKVACMKTPFSQQTISHSQQLDYLEVIASQPDLNTDDLGVVLDASDGLQFEDIQEQSEFNEVMNQAGIKTLENSGVSSYSYDGTYIEAQLQRGTAGDFINAELLTESGSGVVFSFLDDVLERDQRVQFNVVSYNDSLIRENNETPAGQILSIEAFYLNDTGGTQLSLTNLTYNITVVFDGLNLDTTLPYECIYLLPNITWSTYGCYLSSLLNDVAQCSCNHLSQFSMRQINSSASVDTNIGATVEIENIEKFDINKSLAPTIALGVIYGTYTILLILFWRLDWKKEKIKTEIFLRSRSMRLASSGAFGNQHVVEPQTGDPIEQSLDLDHEMIVQDLEKEATYPIYDEQGGMLSALANIDKQPKTTESPQLDDDHILPKDEVPVETFHRQNAKVIPIQKPVETLSTGRTKENQSNMSALETEGELTGDPWIQEEKPKPKCGRFRSIFLDKHLIIGMLLDKHGRVSRAEKLTIILVLWLLELFAIGIFYDSDKNDDEEETEDDQSIGETIMNFGWKDFWIMFYTILIVIPIPFILKALFRRKDLDPEKEDEEIEKSKKKMRTRRIIWYLVCFVICVWCTWSIVAFSTEFGHNKSLIWLVNFGITTFVDFIFKDQILALIRVYVALYLPVLKEKCKCKKKKKQIMVDSAVDTNESPKANNHLVLME